MKTSNFNAPTHYLSIHQHPSTHIYTIPTNLWTKSKEKKKGYFLLSLRKRSNHPLNLLLIKNCFPLSHALSIHSLHILHIYTKSIWEKRYFLKERSTTKLLQFSHCPLTYLILDKTTMIFLKKKHALSMYLHTSIQSIQSIHTHTHLYNPKDTSSKKRSATKPFIF